MIKSEGVELKHHVPPGFRLVWEHHDWNAYARENVTLYEHKTGEWSISENQVWLAGVFSSAEEALKALHSDE